MDLYLSKEDRERLKRVADYRGMTAIEFVEQCVTRELRAYGDDLRFARWLQTSNYHSYWQNKQ
jgi:hypothetical protein